MLKPIALSHLLSLPIFAEEGGGEFGISAFSIRVLLLFLPGIICSYVFDSLSIHRRLEAVFFILRAFVLGCGCYFLIYLLLTVVHCWKYERWALGMPGAPFPDSVRIGFFDSLLNEQKGISFTEVLCTCLMGVGLGLFLAWESNKKLWNKLWQRLYVTKKFGELDVWGYVFNADSLDLVTVRDLRNDLAYSGTVVAFSDDGKDAEILLSDVVVQTNSTAEYLYSCQNTYIARDRNEIVLEYQIFRDKHFIGDQENADPQTPQSSDRPSVSQRGNSEEGRGKPSAAERSATSAGSSTAPSATSYAGSPRDQSAPVDIAVPAAVNRGAGNYLDSLPAHILWIGASGFFLGASAVDCFVFDSFAARVTFGAAAIALIGTSLWAYSAADKRFGAVVPTLPRR